MSKPTILYFAYGSNLCLRQFTRRCPGHVIVGRAIARNYRLVFPRYARDWKSAVAGIEPHPGQHVEGALYYINDRHVEILDEYEGIEGGHYIRGQVEIERDDQPPVTAMTYFANPQKTNHGPNRRYVQTILNGAKDHALSQPYQSMLESLLAKCPA